MILRSFESSLMPRVVTFHGNVKLFKSLLYINVHVPINRFVNPFTLQNDLLIAFSLYHNSADNNEVPFVVCK